MMQFLKLKEIKNGLSFLPFLLAMENFHPNLTQIAFLKYNYLNSINKVSKK